MGDVAPGFHVEVANQFSIGSGLDGHQNVAQNVGGVGFHFVFGEGNFYTALHNEVAGVRSVQVAFPAATGMDLGFHGHNFGAELVVSGQCLVNGGAMHSFEHGNAVCFEQCLTLILVDVHVALQT